jgi:hypothetical protein
LDWSEHGVTQYTHFAPRSAIRRFTLARHVANNMPAGAFSVKCW